MQVTYTETVTLKTLQCSCCGIVFSIPENLMTELRRTHASFYCPNGHSQYYPQDNETEKLRKELRRKEQELADTVQLKIRSENLLIKTQRDLNRMKKGVCPCCNRSFRNVREHMRKQHPETIKK